MSDRYRSARLSTPAILFSVYLFIGLVLMIVAVAAPGREKRTRGFEAGGSGSAIDAGLMIFIAVLWPIWGIAWLLKKERKDPKQKR